MAGAVALYQIVGGSEAFVSSASTTVSAIISSVSSGRVPEVQIVSSGGAATATSVTNGGAQQVLASGTATGTVVETGGFATVLAGGSVTALQDLAGGVFTDAGTASGTVVSSGGTQQLASGGLALATVVMDIGTEFVFYGGTASGTEIESGGTEVVWGGGTAIGVTVSSGAVEIVSAGTASGTTVDSGGLVEVLDGAGAAGLQVASGGVVIVAPGASVPGLVSASGAEVISTGVVVVFGAAVIGGPSSTLSGNTIGNGYTEFVLPGGTAIGTVLEFVALEQVYSGGTATPIMSGGTLVNEPPIPGLPPTTGSNILPDGNFAVSGISSAVWTQPTDGAAFLSSTLGGPAPVYPGTEVEQPAVSGITPLPGVVSGALQLTLDTFNPTGAGSSFQGAEVETQDSFTVTSGGSFTVTSGGTTISSGSGGLAFTAVGKFPTSVPPGIVAGMFLYNFSGTTKLHDEIDFEARSDFAGGQNNQIQVNLYNNAPLGLGSPALVSIPDLNLETYQTYTIEWLPNQVVWLINGTPVYASSNVPHDAMQFDLNIWAYDAAGSLPPSATSPGTLYNFDVQSVSVTPIAAVPSLAQLAATSDFSGSGMSDVLWQNDNAQDSGSGQTAIWLMDGVNPTAEDIITTVPTSWHVVATGDFYGTGDADILWQNDDGQAAIWEMNGTTPIAETVFASPPADWHMIATGDFNGDGLSDVLWQYEDTGNSSDSQNGNVAIWEMNGTSAIATAVVAQPGPDWDVIGTGDFNGDGMSDILWQYEDSQNASDPQNGNVAIWEMNGLTPIAEAVIAQPGPDWHVVGTGDFNGDGKADILWQYEDAANSSDPQNGNVAIWLMNGTTPTAEAVVAQPGSAWHAIGTGDYDGSGRSGILWQNTDGQAAIWLMNGLTPTTESVFAAPPSSWHVIPS